MTRNISGLAAILLLFIATVAPSAAANSPATPTGTPWPFPGLYLPDGVAASVAGTKVSLMTSMKCPALLDALDSGEWRMTVRGQPYAANLGATAGWYAELARSDQTAVVEVGGDTYCTGSIELASVQPIALTGTVHIKGTAHAFPLLCLTASKGTAQLAIVYEGPGKLRTLVGFTVVEKKGTTSISTDGLEVGVATSSESAINLWIDGLKASAAAAKAGGDTSDSNDFGAFQTLGPGDSYSGVAKIVSISPLTGTITLNGLAGSDGQPASLKVGFSCA